MNGMRGVVSVVTANVSLVSHDRSRFVNHGLVLTPLTPPGRLDCPTMPLGAMSPT